MVRHRGTNTVTGADLERPDAVLRVDLDVSELSVRILEALHKRRRPHQLAPDSLASLTREERDAALRAAHAAIRFFNEAIIAAAEAAHRSAQNSLN